MKERGFYVRDHEAVFWTRLGGPPPKPRPLHSVADYKAGQKPPGGPQNSITQHKPPPFAKNEIWKENEEKGGPSKQGTLF